MNEFYIITVLMIYVLLVLSETLLEYSHVLTDRIDDVEDKIISSVNNNWDGWRKRIYLS